MSMLVSSGPTKAYTQLADHLVREKSTYRLVAATAHLYPIRPHTRYKSVAFGRRGEVPGNEGAVVLAPKRLDASMPAEELFETRIKQIPCLSGVLDEVVRLNHFKHLLGLDCSHGIALG